MEKRKLEYGVFRIALCYVGIDIGEVNTLGNKSLVITAIRVYHRHDDMHAVNVPQKRTVSAVTDVPFCIVHILYLIINYFFEYV